MADNARCSRLRIEPRWIFGIALAVLVVAASAGPGNAASNPMVEPNALRLLDSAAAYLKGQNSFAFSANIRADDAQTSGLTYQVNAVAKFQVKRPGEMLVDYAGDRRNVVFVNDGKNFVLFDRGANVYATTPATGDNDTTLNAIFTKFDFTVPLADLVSNDPAKALAGKLESGYDLGASSVDGAQTHHLVFTQSDIDWQIWIDTGATPLIRELVITYKKLPGHPQYGATFSDWSFAPLDPSAFAFTPPTGAVRVEFVAASSGTK